MTVAALIPGVRAEEKKADNAKLLVGTWVVSKAEVDTVPKGAVLEFAKEGKAKFTAQRDGRESTIDGPYVLIALRRASVLAWTITVLLRARVCSRPDDKPRKIAVLIGVKTCNHADWPDLDCKSA